MHRHKSRFAWSRFELRGTGLAPFREDSPGVAMHQGKLVFAQVMAHLPLSTFRRCVARYDGEHKVKSFSCLDQFYAMAFAQLTFRESLRDIEACLATQGTAAVSPGLSLAGGAQHAGQRQRDAAVADLRRFGSALDRHRPAAVCERADRVELEGDGLRVRRHDHRPVPVGVPVGAVSLDQGGHQAAHAARRARLDPQLHPHQRRQDARGQCAGRADAGAGRVLPARSRLYGLRSAARACTRPAASS